MKRKPHKNSL